MPKKKMKFPEVPGDTPRERFMNLVRHVFAVPKTQSKRLTGRPKVITVKTE
jgi:hypothetical protein